MLVEHKLELFSSFDYLHREMEEREAVSCANLEYGAQVQ